MRSSGRSGHRPSLARMHSSPDPTADFESSWQQVLTSLQSNPTHMVSPWPERENLTLEERETDYDETTQTFHFDAHASVFPERLGPAYTKLAAAGARNGLTGPQTLQALVDRGLRAQIKSSNILTGAYYIDLAWFPNAKPAHVIAKEGVWVVPTERGGSEQMQERVASILSKIDRIPFEEIGGDVHDATRAASSLLGHFDSAVVPAMQGVFARADTAMSALHDSLAALRDNIAAPDSAIQQATRATLEQVERAAFSLRTLADYLGHHPESLVRGRASGSEPKGK